MMIIAITEETYELCTALNGGEPPVVHGTPTFLVWNPPEATIQCFAWELEDILPADNAKPVELIIYTERNKSDQ